MLEAGTQKLSFQSKLFQSIYSEFSAWGNLGNILNAQRRHVEAEAAYRHALFYRSNMADVHYNLGILLQELGRSEEAIESYQKAITCRPKLTGKLRLI